MHQNEMKKNLDWSMRQPIRDHCTLRESSHHCPHYFPTRIPMLLPYLGWATVESRRNKCVSNLLNLISKERIKVRKTPVYFPYNSIVNILVLGPLFNVWKVCGLLFKVFFLSRSFCMDNMVLSGHVHIGICGVYEGCFYLL